MASIAHAARTRTARTTTALAALIALAGCSQGLTPVGPTGDLTPPDDGSVDPSTPAPSTPDPNEPPLAFAGEDLLGVVAQEIELDGSGSYDPDGDALEFDWTMTSRPVGSSATLINASRTNPSFYADREGAYVITLAVSDGLDVATDQVQVLVEAPNEGPVANSGPDQTVDKGDRVVLNGSASYDPDGDPLDFAWTLVSVPGGSAAALDTDDAALSQFVADQPGVYVAELVVSDGIQSSMADQVRITAVESSDTGCLSCAAAEGELRRRSQRGTYASVGLLGLLQAVFVLRRRRRLVAGGRRG